MPSTTTASCTVWRTHSRTAPFKEVEKQIRTTSQRFSEFQYSHTGMLERRNLPTPTRPPRLSAEALRQLGITPTPRDGKERRVRGGRGQRKEVCTTIRSAGAESDDAGPASELDSIDCYDHNEDGDLGDHQYESVPAFNSDLPPRIDDDDTSNLDAAVDNDDENDCCDEMDQDP